MKTKSNFHGFPPALAAILFVCGALTATAASDDFAALVKRMEAEKPAFAARQQKLLAERYDLADRPAPGVVMSIGKPVQVGVRVKLPDGITWEQLAGLSPAEIKARNLWPIRFYPLPHPHHEEGGMVFPQPLIDETKRQTGRDLTRFDLDYDFPQHPLPEFPALPYYTDNSMHNLRAERFYAAKMINGVLAGADGPIKNFPLRGIKDSPPYLHDDRLLTLDAPEKQSLVAFLRTL